MQIEEGVTISARSGNNMQENMTGCARSTYCSTQNDQSVMARAHASLKIQHETEPGRDDTGALQDAKRAWNIPLDDLISKREQERETNG